MIGLFDECLNFDLDKYKTEAGYNIEGVVIKPYEDDYTEPFYIKKKMLVLYWHVFNMFFIVFFF